MNLTMLRVPIFVVAVLATPILTWSWIQQAEARLVEAESTPVEQEIAIASASDEGYCSADLKNVLRRVLRSCGLLSWLPNL